jgi:hypothetical protein
MELLSRRIVGYTGVGFVAAVLSTGCVRPLQVEQADAGEKIDADTFLHEHLQKQAAVTVAEAYRAMVILATGDDQLTTFEERKAYLEEQDIARPAWNLKREQHIDRGAVAYMVTRIIELKGGLNRETFGRLGVGDRRYALRELIYRDMIRDAPDYQFITGGEMVHLMGKGDRWMAEHDIYAEAVVDIVEELRTTSGEPPLRQ